MSLLFVCMLFVNSRPSSTCLHSARPPRETATCYMYICTQSAVVCLPAEEDTSHKSRSKAQVPEAFETLTRFLHQSDTWQLAFGCLWGKIWKDHEAWASIHCKLYTGVWGAVFRCCFFSAWLMFMSDMMQDDAGMLQHCCLEEFKRHRKSRLLGSGNVFGPI